MDEAIKQELTKTTQQPVSSRPPAKGTPEAVANRGAGNMPRKGGTAIPVSPDAAKPVVNGKAATRGVSPAANPTATTLAQAATGTATGETTAATPATVAPADTTAAASADTANAAAAGGAYVPNYATDANRIGAINDMYSAALNTQKLNLENAYNQNVSNINADREKLTRQYAQQRSNSAAEYERQRRNFNEQAMTNGLNTGASSQAALAQNSAYQRTMGGLRASEAAGLAENDRSLTNLTMSYQNDINAAIADNDYKKAGALLDEYNTQYAQFMENARIRAEFGDFSGYAAIFGQEYADLMQKTWAMENPGIGYAMGLISASEYKKITGRKAPGSGGGGGGGRSYGIGGAGSSGDGDPDPDALGTGVTPSGQRTGGATVAQVQAGRNAAINASLIANGAKSAPNPGNTLNGSYDQRRIAGGNTGSTAHNLAEFMGMIKGY